jgi:(p)ppGpp synthase/HD superfamily hydrolase
MSHAHAGQVDKAGMPYYLHPMYVGEAVQPLGEDYAIVGFLHDVLEDSLISQETIRDLFGTDVMSACLLLRRGGREYSRYIDRIIGAQKWERHHAAEIAKAVKIVDLHHNLSRPDSLPDSLRKRYLKALRALTLGGAA